MEGKITFDEQMIIDQMVAMEYDDLMKRWMPAPTKWSHEMKFTRPKPGVEAKFGEEEISKFLKEEYIELQNKMDETGDLSPAYALVDGAGVVQPWRLIMSVNGPCWQNMNDRSQFQSAFEDTAVTKLGHREVVIMASTAVMLKDGKLFVKSQLGSALNTRVKELNP